MASMGKRRSMLVLFALLPLLGASCAVRSKHPLSDEKNSQLDDRLIGRWRIVDREKGSSDKRPDGIISVSKSGERKLEATVTLETSPQGEGDRKKCFVFTTRVDSQSYMSVRAAGGDFLLLAYSFPDKDAVAIWGLDQTKLAAAIGTKELQGKVESRWLCAFVFGFVPIPFKTTSVMIEGDPEALMRYIQKHGADALDKTCWLKLTREM
jgi:hypothetical protein